MGNTVGRGNGNAASDKFGSIEKLSPLSLFEHLKLNLRKHSRVKVWWPKDRQAYPGKIVDIEDKTAPDGQISSIVTVLYDDKTVRQYPMDTLFYNRAAIGQVTHICIEVKCSYNCMLLFTFRMNRQFQLSPELATKVLNEDLSLELARVRVPKHWESKCNFSLP